MHFVYKLIMLLVFVLPAIVPTIGGLNQVFLRDNQLGWFWIAGGTCTAIGLCLTLYYKGFDKIW